MSSTVRHLFALLVYVLTFSALVAALSLHAGINNTKIPPRWFRDRRQKHPLLGESTQVPTFFQRRNKDGKTVNAFEEGAWCKIQTRNSGKDTNTNFASRTSRITINIVWSFRGSIHTQLATRSVNLTFVGVWVIFFDVLPVAK